MPTPTKGKRLGGSPAHERAMLANLATGLFEHGRITTTETRARRLRPFAERLITKARRGDLHARRQVMRVIRDRTVVHVLFTEIGPRFATRPGGYTRITKVGPRPGDNAPMAVIELVEELTAAASDGSPAQQGRQAPPQASAPAGSETEQPEQESADEAAAEGAAGDSDAAEEGQEPAVGTTAEEGQEPAAEEGQEPAAEEATETPSEDVSAQAEAEDSAEGSEKS